jgi:NAD(P)-dependent dehydrogenase (short-subunit alcohol dehydrogenase family)
MVVLGGAVTDPDGAAVVVGGASGIGAAVADRYRAAGTAVVVWDVKGEADVDCDVTDEEQVDAAVATTLEQLGAAPTEVTVTAGIGHSGLLTEVDRAEWDRVLAVNLTGPWLVMRAWARHYAAHDLAASMVATSSVSARLVDRSMGAYCTSKAGLSMTVRVAAAEWAPAIRVNAVGPGVTATPMLWVTGQVLEVDGGLGLHSPINAWDAAHGS